MPKNNPMKKEVYKEDNAVEIKESKHMINALAFVLLLIGSLFLLSALFYSNFVSVGIPTLTGSSVTLGSIWLSILYGVAVVSTLTLLLLSFMILIPKMPFAERYSISATMISGFSVIILSMSSSIEYASAIAGFIIALIGGILVYKTDL
ncbi:MAG: hypothetical protein ACP5LP_03425 [Candidatus Micrarchaeia archaeon]